ncbi:unnamed protein product [Polarella glacialis]|uniref:Uncharacterized protein n=1 Tax=Polarella glacialis TaxID=89957 RepID=A0A813LFC6_POLGL|nr:unnamed protein product [Polarella glacialis]
MSGLRVLRATRAELFTEYICFPVEARTIAAKIPAITVRKSPLCAGRMSTPKSDGRAPARSDAANDADAAEAKVNTPRDRPKGSVGWVYEDVFKDLYKPPVVSTSAEDPDPAAEEAPAAGAEPGQEAADRPEDGEVDFSAEDDEIVAIRARIEEEQNRLAGVVENLSHQQAEAADEDRKEAEHLQQRWGLVMREQVPVPESKLRGILDPNTLDEEGLVIPREMMTDMERYFEIKKGTIPHHDNLLAISKPEEPNYFQTTKSVKIRMQVSGIQPSLSEAQKTMMSEELEERIRRRPRMPPGLNAEEKAKNREIVKRMQMKISFLKNPRYNADRAAKDKGEPCPFWSDPESVIFRNYEVGGLYEVNIQFRNVTGIGRRLRVLPCKSPAFSMSQLRFDVDSAKIHPGKEPCAVVAPGMAAYLTVRFAPSTLNDETDALTIATEFGDYSVPVLARRVQPKLEFQEPVNCGCILAGNTTTEAVRISNQGGEGSFRLILVEEGMAFHYETLANGDTTMACGPFRITPASFYLEAGQSATIQVHFSASEVGRHHCRLFLECDNGTKTPLTLVSIADAVRLELAKWPTLSDPVGPRQLEKDSSPWNLIPWQLNWLTPGTQVGFGESQTIELANGGYLPIKVEWCLAQPPKGLLSHLAVGAQQRLTEDIVSGINTWAKFKSDLHGTEECPYSVSPASLTIPPFSTASFSFSFKAYAPVGRQSTVFAYLVAKELPDTSHCLLHYSKLLDLQGPMQPEEYRKGLPLFGGAVSAIFDRQLRQDTKCEDIKIATPTDCTVSHVVTAICLKGISTKSTVTILPRVLALSGDVLPFVSHSREIKLRNSGPMPAYFRVRLTSTVKAADADRIDPLWVVSVPEVGHRPAIPEHRPDADPKMEELLAAAQRLATQWPPLPPEEGSQGAATKPGYGALASAAVEPHEGRIPPGGTVTIRVTLRAVRESDLDGQLVIDLPVGPDTNVPAQPSIKVGVVAAVRAPRAELRRSKYLDYGVVRAHSRHTMKVCVVNPTELPMLVQLRHLREDDVSEPPFPVLYHREVVNLFVNSVNGGSTDGFAAVLKEKEEEEVEPWVHSRSGCLDKSGRKKYAVKNGLVSKGRAASMRKGVADDQDFVFRPGYLALFPRQSAEVEVTLMTREVGRYSQVLEAVVFDSLSRQCLEVLAEVQLPTVRLFPQHAHFPVAYLRTTSAPLELEIRNNSDMPANYHWDVPVKLEAALEVQIFPANGTIPPRGKVVANIMAVASREVDGEIAVLPCNLFVDDILQPLELRVSAQVYGCEVDFAVIEPDQLAPEIIHEPRKLGDEPGSTYQITVGRAPRSMPLVDFGEMELQKAKVMKIVLYNRTGIATPFSAKIEKNPAFDPLVKGRKALLSVRVFLVEQCVFW